MRYRIGSFRRLTGLSEATLRFYEQKGLLCPWRDGDNDYRSYGETDLLHLVQITQYSSFGLALADLPGEEREVSALAMGEKLSARRKSIENEINELYDKLGRIKLHEANFQKFATEGTKVTTANIGGIYRLFLSHSQEAEDPRTMAIASRWFSHMPFTHGTLRIAQADLLAGTEGPYRLELGLGLLERYFNQLGETFTEPMLYSPPNTCITGLIVVGDLFSITPRDLEPFFRYLKEEGLVPVGDLFGWIVFSTWEAGSPRYYLSLRIAVA